MIRKRKAKKSDAPIEAFKAFNPDMSCNGFKYEIGASYEHAGDVRLCAGGFHAVTVPFDAWNYYSGSKTLARVIVAQGVQRADDDSKVVGGRITIEASLNLPEWIAAQARTIIGLCKTARKSLASREEQCAAATGNYGHAAATGYRGHAAATGNYGHAAATGEGGHAAATGYRGHAAAVGNGIAAALGHQSTARAAEGGFVVLVQYDDDGRPTGAFFSAVGINGVEAGKNYSLDGYGEVVEVPNDLICC